MAELGDEYERYYRALIEGINQSQIDTIYLIGQQYVACADMFSAHKHYILLADVEAFKDAYLKDIQDGDIVLLKGSHSTQVWKLVSWLKRLASR